MIVEGTPRQLAAKRAPDYGLKVYATEAVELAGVVVGSVGYVDGIYANGSVLVYFHGSEHGQVLYDRAALLRSTKPFQWVYLRERAREVATLYKWS